MDANKTCVLRSLIGKIRNLCSVLSLHESLAAAVSLQGRVLQNFVFCSRTRIRNTIGAARSTERAPQISASNKSEAQMRASKPVQSTAIDQSIVGFVFVVSWSRREQLQSGWHNIQRSEHLKNVYYMAADCILSAREAGEQARKSSICGSR